MKLWNPTSSALDLRDRWVKQYGDRAPDLAEKLLALGPNPSPGDVDETFNDYKPGLGWANQVERKYTCDECKLQADEVVELGEEPDYESHAARICSNCVLEAVKLIDGK
jgi:hypothetical protein